MRRRCAYRGLVPLSTVVILVIEALASPAAAVWSPIRSDGFGHAGLIQCVFREIEVEKGDHWFEATAAAFGVSPGETVKVKVRKRDGKGKETIHVTWDDKRREVSFCKGPGSGRTCEVIPADGRRFASGTRITFHISEEARGTAACRYTQ